MGNCCCIKTKDEQTIVDTQEFKDTLYNVTDTNMASASTLDHEGSMGKTCCIKADGRQSIVDTQELNNVLYNPNTTSASISDHEGSMDNSCCNKTKNEQTIVVTQELKNTLRNATDTNMASASSLDHEGEPLVSQVDLECGKTAVSIPVDNSLSQPALALLSNGGSLRRTVLHNYSAAGDNEEKLNVMKDQAKMSDILDNSELLLKLAIMIGKDWQKLGRFLSVSITELDVIDADYYDMEEKTHRMFNAWKNQQRFPTLNVLANAIYKINRLDLIRVMEKLSNKSFEVENSVKPSIEDKVDVTKALKIYYLKIYKTTEQLVHKMITPIDVELSDKFVELTLVDANEVEKDAENNSEGKDFLQKHLSHERICLQKVLSLNSSLLLISGIAGIGKTLFLKKCLLDWAKGSIWKSIDLVFFLECRQLNLNDGIGSIDKLLNFYYKDFVEGFSTSDLSMLFLVDGLDEFLWLDELLKHNSKKLSQHPIVNALADTLNFGKAKCIIAGRVDAILKCKYWNKKDKIVIQIMGFNNDGINDYIEKNTHKNQTESVNNVLEESYAAKAMASVPFYLTVMCSIITSTSEKYYSFNTMTELYCCNFLYFLQKHINKNKEPIWKVMESASVKEYICKICKIAFKLLKQGKVIFTDSKKKQMGNFNDHDDDKVFHFIEKIESNAGYRYQFVHITLMEFCASVHAYICLTPSEIMRDKRIRSLLPMKCGLANRDSSCFVNFIAKIKKSREEKHSLILEVLNFLLKARPRSGLSSVDRKLFLECFFEAQASITEDLKKSINERRWGIVIKDGKTAIEVSHEKYFMQKFFDAGCKLNHLWVDKNILSEDEKKLIILCSTNVRDVNLNHPVKIDGWTPTHKIEWLRISTHYTFVSKNEFEGFFLPWIRLADELNLYLHDDTNFIDDICEWLRDTSFRRLMISTDNCGECFNNIEEFKERNTKKFLKS